MAHRKVYTCILFLFFFSGYSYIAAQSSSDWLIDSTPYQAQIQTSESEITLENGLIRRVFSINPNGATIGFDNLMTGETILRGVKPEAEITLNGKSYPVGGLTGQPNYAFLTRDWIQELANDPQSLQFVDYQTGKPQAPFEWKRVRHHGKELNWPPKRSFSTNEL
ncbi:MAG: hypothetical protein R3B93_10405 [Bacteroidia bacterium]